MLFLWLRNQLKMEPGKMVLFLAGKWPEHEHFPTSLQRPSGFFCKYREIIDKNMIVGFRNEPVLQKSVVRVFCENKYESWLTDTT